MPWLIERRVPKEPTAYWAKGERWFARRPALCFAPLRNPIPDQALRYHDYDVALEIAEWLRQNTSLEFGSVIALVTELEPSA